MIDKATVDQILRAADIVEVVSDFVSLRRRGANYVGLCPFHNEKTPSFSVSKAKGICHCFSCGKGGSPVNFIMEHEQMSYYEALKYLAKKYHIEVKERELSDEERAAQSERESMFIANEFAAKHFESNLFDTRDGREIGLPYFYKRGFSDATIKKFHLGYSMEGRNVLFNEAVKQGHNTKFLFEVGLCISDNRGGGYDRFKGRVMFPVLNVAGKVIAFGGRTLKNDPAKYINSPESKIYHKSNELYGLYQAKQAIVKKEKCFLVEGYTDVISMHQAGIENVVASSGTSLTEGQIRMIHRFTENVTVLYDGDSAGIKASLRGIDMLLAEGLNIKVLLLPDGEDPDSFARAHSATEFQQYIDEHESDFIQFKMRILLQGTQNDPLKRSKVIQDVVRSIAVIPNNVTRAIYAKECSRQLDIKENVLLNEIKKTIEVIREEEFKRKQRGEQARQFEPEPEYTAEPAATEPAVQADANSESQAPTVSPEDAKILFPHEETIIRYIVKYGMSDFYFANENGEDCHWTLLEFIASEMNYDSITFSNVLFDKIFQIGLSLVNTFKEELSDETERQNALFARAFEEGTGNIKATDMEGIRNAEAQLQAQLQIKLNSNIASFRNLFLERRLCSHPDDKVRNESIALASEKHHLSKIHTEHATVMTEFDRLATLVPEAMYNWKNAIVVCRINAIQRQLSSISSSPERTEELLIQLQDLFAMRAQLAKYIGERVVNPI